MQKELSSRGSKDRWGDSFYSTLKLSSATYLPHDQGQVNDFPKGPFS